MCCVSHHSCSISGSIWLKTRPWIVENLPWQIDGKPQRSFFHKGSRSLAMSNVAGAPYSRGSVSTTLPSIPAAPAFFWALKWMLSSKWEHPTPSRSLHWEREDRTCAHNASSCAQWRLTLQGIDCHVKCQRICASLILLEKCTEMVGWTEAAF